MLNTADSQATTCRVVDLSTFGGVGVGGGVMRVTPAYLSSVASFYDMLNTEPVGRQYVCVCTSVAGMLKGRRTG